MMLLNEIERLLMNCKQLEVNLIFFQISKAIHISLDLKMLIRINGIASSEQNSSNKQITHFLPLSDKLMMIKISKIL